MQHTMLYNLSVVLLFHLNVGSTSHFDNRACSVDLLTSAGSRLAFQDRNSCSIARVQSISMDLIEADIRGE
jgi:hypothetical protein